MTNQGNDRPEDGAGAAPPGGPNAVGGRKISIDGFGQRRIALALIAASLIVIVAAGVCLSPDAATGGLQWVARGLIQAVYVALLALSVWTWLRRRCDVSYLLLFGIGCLGVAAWDTASGIYTNRVRLEANAMLVTFRDTPLNVHGLTDAIEGNPYVEAYMIMRDAHWEIHKAIDERMAGYAASYLQYVEQGRFLDVKRLQPHLALWESIYQIDDLEDQLALIEADPMKAEDLLWTVDLLDVDAETRKAYAQDLRKAVSAANRTQLEIVARERRTLARIKRSLQVLIDAEGRYSFADGRVVFEDAADAALFAGEESPPD